MEPKPRKNEKEGKLSEAGKRPPQGKWVGREGSPKQLGKDRDKAHPPPWPPAEQGFQPSSAAENEKPLLPHSNEFDIQSMKINSPKVRGFLHPYGSQIRLCR